MIEVLAAPPNSLVLVTDPEIGEVPASMDGLFAATRTCVAIRTMTATDGLTRMQLDMNAGPASAAQEALELVWQGRIKAVARVAV